MIIDIIYLNIKLFTEYSLAEMAELADAYGSGPYEFFREGSSPFFCTFYQMA